MDEIAFIDCPECNSPAEVKRQFYVKTMECADLTCLNGHSFSATADWLVEQNIAYTPLSELEKTTMYFTSFMLPPSMQGADNLSEWLKRMFGPPEYDQ